MSTFGGRRGVTRLMSGAKFASRSPGLAAAFKGTPTKGWKGGRRAPRKAGAGEQKDWAGCGRRVARQAATE